MMQTVLITGGSGLVGMRLSEILTSSQFSVRHLSRNVSGNETYPTYLWDTKKGYIDPKALVDIQHVVHLAGSGIADKRWSPHRKKLILSSRTEGLRLLHQELKKNGVQLKTLVSSSGINYYGFSDPEVIFTEDMPAGEGFLPEVCQAWETEALKFENLASAVSVLRTAIVLSRNGGALTQLIQPIKLGLGAHLGSGKQWMPWIHIDDLCLMYMACIEGRLSGVYNAVADQHVTNAEFTKIAASNLKKPLWLPAVPGFLLRIIFGELAQVLLLGNKASNKKAIDSGFEFNFKTVEKALTDLLN